MKKLLVFAGLFCLILPLAFLGCTGDDGAQGPRGLQGDPGQDGEDLTATANPESCVVCHGTAGDQHQASYDKLYQDNVIVVANLVYAYDNATGNDIVTFDMTKAGAPFDCSKVQNLNIYWAPYDNTVGRFQFDPPAERLAIKGGVKVDNVVTGSLTGDSVSGLCTSTFPSQLDNVDLSTRNGVIVVYGYDELVGTIPSPSRVKQVKYPYAALKNTGTVDYVSAANVKGCEKCHTVPYLKHGNIYGRVNGDAATDMYTCKACHLDNGDGGHFVWQLLVDDPVRAAELWAQAPGDVESLMDNAEIAKYAYKTRLMNDVHMSHAMEFEYPQSMANCATCHEGKLDKIFTDNNFVLETCKSCHPVTGSAQAEKMTNLGLATIVPHTLEGRANCYGCHAGQFSAVTGHTGYDKLIYTDNGVKYSEIFKVTIDNASFDNSLLTFSFHATESPDLPGLSVANIVPTVLVGLYGFDTKDYLVGPHETNADGKRNLEWAVVDNTSHPRISKVSAGGGSWTIRANLSTWADNIANGTIERVEIAVMPRLPNADNVALALDAPSRTFNLGTKTFTDSFYPAIVKVPAGCNNCHDALATTFHTADRGGNIVVCRLCHITKAGGSHLEMQSRSIDSYIHAIHSFQAFDIGDVHFDNALQSMYYDLKVESHFPTFGITDCEACHNKGRYNVPNQSKSLPGLFSASDSLIGRTRNIGDVPMYIAGPASRACGACHRAELIKEDQAVELAAFNQHTRTNGYLIETTSATAAADLAAVINRIMANFSEVIVQLSP